MIGFKIAYYRKKDWNRFIRMIDDRDSMQESWLDWHKDYEKAKLDLINQGYEVVDIVVDLKKLSKFCKQRGLKIDGKARSQFVQQIEI